MIQICRSFCSKQFCIIHFFSYYIFYSLTGKLNFDIDFFQVLIYCNFFDNFFDNLFDVIIRVGNRLVPHWVNPLTPKITDFLTHFCSLLPKRKGEYIMTKPCIHNVFGPPLSIYEVRITLPFTGKPIWQILLKKVSKIWNFFFILFFSNG